MIYHICPPDKLFVAQAIKSFELFKANSNKCIIIVSAHHKIPQSNIDEKYIEYFGPYKKYVVKIINDSKCNGIVIHSLNEDLLKLSLKIRKEIPIFWRSWGADLHDTIYTNFDPLEPETKKITKRSSQINTIKASIKPLYHFLTGKNRDRILIAKKKSMFFERINYISTVTKYEYEKLVQKIPSCNAEKIPLIYISSGLQIPKNFHQDENANGIMIGHSSFSYHNHADTFKILREIGNHSSKLIVPLNYGDLEYGKIVNDLGNVFFKERFVSIFEFKKIEEYLKIVNSCFAFILNSRIQGGGANINYFLSQGSKVYLHEENPQYREMKEQGYSIYSLQSDLTYDHLYKYQLTEKEKLINYKLQSEKNSENRLYHSIRQIYEAFGIVV